VNNSSNHCVSAYDLGYYKREILAVSMNATRDRKEGTKKRPQGRPLSRRIPPPSPAEKVWRRRQPNFGRRAGALAEIYGRRRRGIFSARPGASEQNAIRHC